MDDPLYNPPFFTSVGRGSIPGWEPDYVSAIHSSLPTSEECIWPGAIGAGYERPAFPTASIAMSIASESANDGAGTLAGALTVSIRGLTLAGLEVNETAILNGQTAVAIATEMARVLHVEVLTVGASGFNEGRLWVGSGVFTAGVPLAATAFYAVHAESNFGDSGFYSVGATKHLMLIQAVVSVATGKTLDLSFLERHSATDADFSAATPFTRQRHIEMPNESDVFTLPFPMSAKPLIPFSDVMLVGKVDATTAEVAVSLDVIIRP